MRILILTVILIVAVALQMHAQDHDQHAIHDRAPADSLKGSPSRLTKATIGKADVEIAYGPSGAHAVCIRVVGHEQIVVARVTRPVEVHRERDRFGTIAEVDVARVGVVPRAPLDRVATPVN